MARPNHILRATALLGALASSAAAQDADPAGQLVEGYVACQASRANLEIITPTLTQFGWTLEPGEDGITNAMPGAGEATFVMIADDASFCHIESLKIGTTAAAAIFEASMQGVNVTLPAATKSADGCTQYDLGDGSTATLTSGGNDPVCTSETDSAVRFDYGTTTE
jgi:hypothetical protein